MIASKDLARLHHFFRGIDCFASLEESALGIIEEGVCTVRFQPGEVICNEGDPGDWMFIVGSGEVSVIRTTEDGTPVHVAALRAGDFGGIMSLFDEEPRSATLRARDAVELWTLSHDTFQHLIERNAKLARAMLAFMSRRMRHDSHSLAKTLRYVDVSGQRWLYEECSPQERLILDMVNQKVASASSLDAIMNFLFDSMRRVGACDRLGLAFIEEEGRRVTLYWTRADYEPLSITKGYTADLQGSSLEAVLESGQPRVINDLKLHLMKNPGSVSTKLIVREGIRSSMTCPLIVEGRPLGFLFRSSRHPNVFDKHQVQLHLAIAERLTQAVEKAYRIEQLTAANQAYFEMLGFVSHEIKSPLASSVMDCSVLLGGWLGSMEPLHRQKIERIDFKCRYLLDLVGEYLNLSRIESSQLQPNFQQDVNFVDEIIDPAIEIVAAQIEEKGIRLTRDWDGGDIAVHCAPDLLKIVAVNLLSNAVKYGNENGEIRIRLQRQDHRFEVSVWNEGPGFPEEERSKLFRKFSRLQTPELLKQKGTGVGLYTTWKIILTHKGHIRAESEQGKWAQFTFEIPQPIIP
ncbi:MAG TPA: cyclic nucleotide-binding domain-containing protein [Candidatus Hydrogenedentes bacterium]|nr:cyclic nucleotide-binding domain-containing protein [Candidatus Hydrogenedentota bacterium]